jgi:hypothetical protein
MALWKASALLDTLLPKESQTHWKFRYILITMDQIKWLVEKYWKVSNHDLEFMEKICESQVSHKDSVWMYFLHNWFHMHKGSFIWAEGLISEVHTSLG